jgi:pheromone shutdown protein TraB
MARNIAEQVIEKEYKKNIVIVGAGHVIGLKEALEKNYPELKVQLMYED